MRNRPMTDEELDAYIDELNDREAAQAEAQIDRSTIAIIVHGRISNVRWLEAEGATKRKNGKYYEYYLERPSESEETTDLIRRLQDEQENGAGIWFETGY